MYNFGLDLLCYAGHILENELKVNNFFKYIDLSCFFETYARSTYNSELIITHTGALTNHKIFDLNKNLHMNLIQIET